LLKIYQIMLKYTLLLGALLSLLIFSGAMMPQISHKLSSKFIRVSPKNMFWLQNKSSYTFTHLYIVASEDGDADDEFEDDGKDYCKTSCVDEGNEDEKFDPNEIIDIHLGKGKYDLMLRDTAGRTFIEDDIEYHDNLSGISEKNPFVIEDSKLKEIK
jgi:hypothetical protein